MTRPQRANTDRQPYPLALARCTDCEWKHTAPLVQWRHVRTAAMNHGAATGHDVWLTERREDDNKKAG